MNDLFKSEITKLRGESKIAFISSINGDGYPQTKAMLVLETGSLQTQYFSTNFSSKRVQQFLKNPKASVYYCNEPGFKGVDDEDYCVLKFTANTVNYYHGLGNETFAL